MSEMRMANSIDGLDGVAICKMAFLRLAEGLPKVAAHVGLQREKITAGVVSVEAGFDRGYLKKSRASHVELIAQINAYRTSSKSMVVNNEHEKFDKLKSRNKIQSLELAMVEINKQRDVVLAQNILLYERVRELEKLLMLAQSKFSGKS